MVLINGTTLPILFQLKKRIVLPQNRLRLSLFAHKKSHLVFLVEFQFFWLLEMLGTTGL